MSERHTYFYFVLSENLEIPVIRSILVDFSKRVADKGFSIASGISREKGLDTVDSASVKAFVLEKVSESVQKNTTEVRLRFYLKSELGDDIGFTLSTLYRVVLLSVNYNFFRREDTVFAFLDFCSVFHQLFLPFYGYGPTTATDLPDPLKADEGKIEILHTYNFLGPTMVSKYRREKLYSVPAWRIVDLPDGGMFIAMEINPFENWEESRPRYEEAIKILGISRFQQGG